MQPTTFEEKKKDREFYEGLLGINSTKAEVVVRLIKGARAGFEPEDYLKGFKNKFHKKVEVQNLMDEVERATLWIHQLQRKAGFFDKRGNIFEQIEEQVDDLKDKVKEEIKKTDEALKV